MSIFGSVARYLKSSGRLLYVGERGGSPMRAMRKRDHESARTKYLECLEPRVLMTTVFGGESFRYTDAQGRTVTATLSGNVAAELVSAVQAGGQPPSQRHSVGWVSDIRRYRGDIHVGSRAAGIIVGNGSVPVTNSNQQSANHGSSGYDADMALQYPDQSPLTIAST